MARNLINRYVWLVDTISRYGRITLKDLNEAWLRSDISEGKPLARRTFFHYRDGVEEMFDINIQCDKSTFEYYIDHFQEMQTIGREIVLDIKVFANNAAGVDLETEYDGVELVDIIENWLQLNTVQGRFSRQYSSENIANFTQVRIPVYDDRGRAIDANGFAKQLSKMLKGEPYKIPNKVLVKGLGRAVIILGEK